MIRLVSFLFAFALTLCVQAVTKYENFTLQDNQHLIGNSLDDKNYTVSSNANKGTLLMASYVSGRKYKNLTNCRAVGIRFCIAETADVKCVTLFNNNKKSVYEQAPQKVTKGWNYVAFDTPQKLDAAGVYISYTFVQTATNSVICRWYEKADGGSWSLFNGTWNDFSEFYGALCIQLVVEADPLPLFGLSIDGIVDNPLVKNEDGELIVHLVSNSASDIRSIGYTVTMGERTTEGTYELEMPLTAGIDQRSDCPITIPAMDSHGTFPTTLTFTQANGQPIDEEWRNTTTFNAQIVTRRAPRRSVVEEYTGTGCGNCPRGWSGMEYLKENYPDQFIGIAIHQYNAGDPMYCERYAKLGFPGAPDCKVDRKVETDPYYGTTKKGIHLDIEKYSAVTPIVDVEVRGTFSSDMKKVSCDANVEFLNDTGKYSVAFVLTADGLEGETTTWKQDNYYYIASAASNVLDAIPQFTHFFKDEIWGESKVKLTFNDVLIGSSYAADGTGGEKSLGLRHTAGEIANKSYTCTISASALCKAALNYDNIYVNALVIATDGTIANAARARVGLLDGIGTVIADTEGADTHSFDYGVYDLGGRRLNSPAHGLNIVGGRKQLAK